MENVEYPEELTAKVRHIIDPPKGTLSQHLGMQFLKFGYDCVKASMPVDERTLQPFGLLHGGASVALAETLASTAAWLNVDETKYSVVGIEVNANHVRAVREGTVIGTAKPVHKGRKTHVWEIRITTEDDKLVCISRCTLAIVDRIN